MKKQQASRALFEVCNEPCEVEFVSLMRIAILGTRGIPASYGGFETFAEHLSTRFVARGHEVTVYGRAHYVSPRQLEYHGVRLKVLPTIRHKYFDTVVHAFLSAVHAVSARFDAVLICNAANAPFAPILRLTGTPVAINVDGLEHNERSGAGWEALLLARRTLVDNSAKRNGHRRPGDSGLLPGSLQR